MTLTPLPRTREPIQMTAKICSLPDFEGQRKGARRARRENHSDQETSEGGGGLMKKDYRGDELGSRFRCGECGMEMTYPLVGSLPFPFPLSFIPPSASPVPTAPYPSSPCTAAEDDDNNGSVSSAGSNDFMGLFRAQRRMGRCRRRREVRVRCRIG
jgi:hypothetical protein